MKMIMSTLVIVLFACSLALGQDAAGQKTAYWPAWRGPSANGEAPAANPPTTWSESKNIRWKIDIPGKGHSTPVIWNDRIFVTTAVPSDKAVDQEKVKAIEKDIPEFSRKKANLPDRIMEFTVLALRRSDGGVIWKQKVCEEAPAAGTHGDGSWASGSPVTDGERVYAYFGSQGLYCLDLDGNKKWEKRFGTMKIKASFGEGTTPAICGDLIIVNWDNEENSFIVALDKKTGAEKWKIPRPEKSSWATPLVIVNNGQPQIVVNATGRIRAYNPADGSVIWECSGMTTNVVPSPVFDGKNVICMSGFRGSAALAIKVASAAGDISDKPEALAWKRDKDTPYVSSPLLHDGLLYFFKGNDAVLTCVDSATGKPQYEKQAVEGLKQVYSSPVEAGGRVYLTGRNGVTAVIKHAPAYELLATNTLSESFTASAAIVENELYLRGQKSLYCIAEPSQK